MEDDEFGSLFQNSQVSCLEPTSGQQCHRRYWFVCLFVYSLIANIKEKKSDEEGEGKGEGEQQGVCGVRIAKHKPKVHLYGLLPPTS